MSTWVSEGTKELDGNEYEAGETGKCSNDSMNDSIFN